MMTSRQRHHAFIRPTALVLTTALTLPPLLAGCGSGGGQQDAGGAPPPPPGMGTSAQTSAQPMRKQGMTTKQKVVLLAGAAALYYLYKRHQNAKAAQGPNGKYFRSESTGRIYYRDLKTGKFQWVTPPNQPIQVPADQAQEYSGYAGYNGNMNQGQSYGGYGPGAKNYTDGVPASVDVQ